MARTEGRLEIQQERISRRGAGGAEELAKLIAAAMEINQITGTIIEEAIRIHREVGPGLLESVYEAVLAKRLTNRGLKVQCQVPVPVVIDGEDFPVGFRMDMLVEGIVIVELKSVEDVPAVDYKRVQTYLRLQDLRIALLINFGRETLLEGLSRIANKYIEDRT